MTRRGRHAEMPSQNRPWRRARVRDRMPDLMAADWAEEGGTAASSLRVSAAISPRHPHWRQTATNLRFPIRVRKRARRLFVGSFHLNARQYTAAPTITITTKTSVAGQLKRKPNRKITTAATSVTDQRGRAHCHVHSCPSRRRSTITQRNYGLSAARRLPGISQTPRGCLHVHDHLFREDGLGPSARGGRRPGIAGTRRSSRRDSRV